MAMDPALRDELRSEVDDVWAEAIRHLPLSDGAPDPGRAPVEFVAVLRTGDRETVDIRPGRQDRAGGQIAGEGGYLRVDRQRYSEVVLRSGDKVVALDRASSPVFEILTVDDRSHLRLICDLGDAV